MSAGAMAEHPANELLRIKSTMTSKGRDFSAKHDSDMRQKSKTGMVAKNLSNVLSTKKIEITLPNQTSYSENKVAKRLETLRWT